MDKRGFGRGLGTEMVKGVLLVVVMLIMVFTALADTANDVGAAASNISSHSDVYPLTSFFKKKGIILLAFMAGIAIVIISAVLSMGGRK